MRVFIYCFLFLLSEIVGLLPASVVHICGFPTFSRGPACVSMFQRVSQFLRDIYGKLGVPFKRCNKADSYLHSSAVIKETNLEIYDKNSANYDAKKKNISIEK